MKEKRKNKKQNNNTKIYVAVGIVLGIILSATTSYIVADTLINSKDVYYQDNSQLGATNVQAAIDGTCTKFNNQLTTLQATILDKSYPVGSIYMSTSATSPATLFGGTWERYAKGRVLVGIDENQSEFNTVNKVGGNKNLQSHTHNFSGTTNSTGGHSHGITTSVWYNKEGKWDDQMIYGTYNSTTHEQYRTTDAAGVHSHTISGTTESAGTGDSGNLQPYIAVYIWRRIS